MGQNRLKQIENIVTYTFVALFPIFLLPGLPNPFVTAKLILLSAAVTIIFILKAVRNLTSKTKGLVFATSSLDIPVVLLAVAYIVSGYFASPNRMEAFWLPGTASFIVGGALLFFIVHQISERDKVFLKLSLLVSGGLVAFVSVLVGSGALKGMLGLPAYMRSDVFSPAGSLLVVAILLLSLLPIAVELLLYSDFSFGKVFAGVMLGLFSLSLVMSIAGVVKNWNQNQLPTVATSWVVATESLKNSPFMGTGPGNYLTAFSRFIPVRYNATAQWTTRFANANDFYLTIITETGLFGLAALVILFLAFFKKIKAGTKENTLSFLSYVPAITILILLAIFPATPVTILMFFILLALSTRTHVVHLFSPAHETHNATAEGKVSIALVAIPTVLICGACFYLSAQAFRGEVAYQKALNQISAQDGRAAYDHLRSAIAISPYNDRYHVTYGQLNLLLANAIISKKDITDDEKTIASQLVQQSIREGRNAVVLNSQRSGNWAALGSTYRAVIPLAKGADQFAIQSYAQAITLDPLNPNTRLALGGIFYGLKRYEEAIDVFKLAVSVKPDLANARYNLAIAYRDNSQFDKATAELTAALTLVEKDSADYKAIKKEIENVQSKAPKKAVDAPKTDNLTPPSKIEENPGDTQIQIPDDATPPASLQGSATPTP